VRLVCQWGLTSPEGELALPQRQHVVRDHQQHRPQALKLVPKRADQVQAWSSIYGQSQRRPP
jgi:hypothetical protein